MSVPTEDSSFLSRWSRRKVLERESAAAPTVEPPVAPLPSAPHAPPARPAPPAPIAPEVQVAAAVAAAPLTPAPANAETATPAAAPLPTLADVAALTRESDFSRFVVPNVQPNVRNAALSKLFTDPHFNVMDGLDTYIDDYGKPDPLPEGMLRKLLQSHVLGLFDHETEDGQEKLTPEMALQAHTDALAAAAAAAAAAQPALPTELPPHENTALQLQPNDGVGRPGPAASPGQDAGRTS